MKNTIYPTFLTTLFVVVLSGCGSSSDDTTQSSDTQTIADITLSPSVTLTCTNATSFTLTPGPVDPTVTITQNVETKDTLIEVDIDSMGYVTVSNCTKN